MSIWSSIVNLVRRVKPAMERVYMSYRQAGVLVTEDTAMTLSGWWACVSALSRSIAVLPWRVYERTPQGRQPLDNALAWLLNSQPNPEMTAFTFRETLMAHVLNWGNAYAEIQRDLAGRPVALWPLMPDRTKPDRDDNGQLVYRTLLDDGREVTLTPDQVFHLRGLGFDGLTGYSPVRMAARSIGYGIAQDAFGAAFYANGTVLGQVIELPVATMTPDQIAMAEQKYNEGHRGPDKAFKVHVGPTGTKVTSMGMPLTDAQFIESRQFTVNECARWLGVPPHKIADLTRSTNNNIEHQGIEFVTDAVVPWATRIEQEANIKLFGARALGRVYTKLMVNALMRGDSKTRAEFYKTMLQLGVYSINEVRELEELNGIGDVGDVRLVQLNQTTLDYLVANPGGKMATPPAEPAQDPAAPAEGDPQEPQDPPHAEPAPTTNVIRAAALEWARTRRNAA